MKSTHGGDSFAKKLARRHTWDRFEHYLGSQRGDAGRYRIAVLCGHEGWDVKAALSFGFLPSEITAIDHDAAAIKAARNAAGSDGERVDWRVADFCEVIASESFHIVFMDTCATVLRATRDALPSIVEAALGGHFLEESNEYIAATSVLVCVGGMYGRDGRYLRESRVKQPALRRWLQLNDEITEEAARNGCTWLGLGAASYTSSRRDDDGKVRGVPMLYTFGHLQRNLYQDAIDEMRATGKKFRLGDARLRPRQHRKRLAAISRQQTRKALKGHMKLLEIGSDLDGAKIKLCAIELAERIGTIEAARQLTLPEGTVRAWLAHETRGTYAAP